MHASVPSMGVNTIGRALVACAAGMLALAAGTSATASTGESESCFHQLERPSAAEIACSLVTRLTDQEREELRRLTRDMLRDAGCTVSVRVERRLVEAVQRSDDQDVEVPPQPVRCEVVTRNGVWVVTATFAPRVVVRDGAAVDATPGLDRVEGVAKPVAWPVVQYVNRSATIRDGMIRMVNAWLAHRALTSRERR